MSTDSILDKEALQALDAAAENVGKYEMERSPKNESKDNEITPPLL
jgi:hypothetical protein